LSAFVVQRQMLITAAGHDHNGTAGNQ
jgi:hypothetical protein